MANAKILKREDDLFPSSIFDSLKDNLFIDLFVSRESLKSRGQLIEKKIDIIETLAGKVSNRRSRRWLNDRLLIELVPRLNVEEIRGLFAPPPWGDNTPVSAFCMTNVGEWDIFRNIDMDAEARIIKSIEKPSLKRKNHVDNDKAAAMSAWHRVDCRTREALRRSPLSDLVEGYEARVLAFINDSGEGGVLVLHVQDPFHRVVLHGVCEFYNMGSATVSTLRGVKLWKMTKITKRSGYREMPNDISLSGFLKMAKNGAM